MIGYKVLSVRHKKLYSWMETAYDMLRYITDKVTIPREGNGPLAVFEDLKSAIAFAQMHSSGWLHKYRIYECRYVPSEQSGLWYKHKTAGVITMYTLPPGTALASAVRITKRVR